MTSKYELFATNRFLCAGYTLSSTMSCMSQKTPSFRCLLSRSNTRVVDEWVSSFIRVVPVPVKENLILGTIHRSPGCFHIPDIFCKNSGRSRPIIQWLNQTNVQNVKHGKYFIYRCYTPWITALVSRAEAHLVAMSIFRGSHVFLRGNNFFQVLPPPVGLLKKWPPAPEWPCPPKRFLAYSHG